MIDARADQRRNNHCGHAHAELIESKSPLIVRRWAVVIRRWSTRRDVMIVEASVFIVSNDEQAVVPDSRVPNRFVDCLDQLLSTRNAVHRMLRRAAFV